MLAFQEIQTLSTINFEYALPLGNDFAAILDHPFEFIEFNSLLLDVGDRRFPALVLKPLISLLVMLNILHRYGRWQEDLVGLRTREGFVIRGHDFSVSIGVDRVQASVTSTEKVDESTFVVK
jgi:hypothetical protein